jgi:GAF domain-containing protein
VPGDVRNIDEGGRVNRLFAVLYRVSEAIVRLREPQELYEEACRIAVEDGHFLLAWIGFVGPGSQYIHVVARHGHDEGYLDTVKLSLSEDVAEGRGPTGTALREGRVFINNDTANNPIMRPWREEQLKRGFRSSASFPLRSQGATVGVITLYAAEPNYFDDEETRLLTCLADDFSFAIEAAEISRERALAVHALQESRTELAERVAEVSAAYEEIVEERSAEATFANALNRISEGVHSSLDLRQIMDRAMVEITRVLMVDAAVVQVRREGRWEFAYAHGLPEELRSVHLDDADVPLAMEVCRTREPIFVTDVARDQRVNVRTMQKFGITALMAVPVIVRGDVFGVLIVDRFGEPTPFSEQQLDFLQKAATILSLGLENLRLFDAEVEAQQRAQRELVNTRLLQATAEAATTSTSIQEAAQSALQAIARVTELKVGSIYSYDQEAAVLDQLAWYGLESARARFLTIPVTGDSSALVAKAVLARGIVTTDDTAISEERARILADAGLRTSQSVAIAIRHKGSVVGCASLVFERDDPFDPDELELFRSLGRIVGQAIENARLFEEVQMAGKRESILREIAEDSSSSLELGELGQRAAGRIMAIFAAAQIQVRVVSDDGLLLESAAIDGDDEGFLQRMGSMPVQADTETAKCYRSGRPSFGDVVSQAGITETSRRNARDASVSSYALLPLVASDATIGTLYLAWEHPRHFADEERLFLESVASELAVGLENAKLYQAKIQAQVRAERELATTRSLLSTARALVSHLTLHEVLEELCEATLRSVPHARVNVSLWDDGWLETAGSAGIDPIAVGMRFPVTDLSGPAQSVIREMRPVLIDYDRLGSHTGSVGERVRSRLAFDVPLAYQDRFIGLLAVDDGDERKEFDDRDLEVIQGIASQASLAIENARLYESERKTAETLQRALLVLPHDLPRVDVGHAYRSATDTTLVGGDFYDLFELGAQHIGITVGDISGKGLGAAVLTSLVKNAIRAHAAEGGKTPARIIALTNDLVFRSTPIEAFATVFFGILDTQNGELTYCNAGHPTGAVVREQGVTSKLTCTGPIVGGFEGVIFAERVAKLGPNDLLFLYTDGLTEARHDRTLYGEERLFELLSSLDSNDPDEVVDEVVLDVMAYSDNRLRDDLAVVALRLQAS